RARERVAADGEVDRRAAAARAARVARQPAVAEAQLRGGAAREVDELAGLPQVEARAEACARGRVAAGDVARRVLAAPGRDRERRRPGDERREHGVTGGEARPPEGRLTRRR